MSDGAIGLEPTATPATTDSAAAAAATDAATRLCGRIFALSPNVARAGATATVASESECPNVWDVKTSSSVAYSSELALSGVGPSIILHQELSGGGSVVRDAERPDTNAITPSQSPYSDRVVLRTRVFKNCRHLV